MEQEPGARAGGQSQSHKPKPVVKAGVRKPVGKQGWRGLGQGRSKIGASLGTRQAQKRSQWWAQSLSSQRSVVAVGLKNRFPDSLANQMDWSTRQPSVVIGCSETG